MKIKVEDKPILEVLSLESTRYDVPKKHYDPEVEEPVIRASICTGEQVACMRNRETGQLREIMLIRDEGDLGRYMYLRDNEKGKYLHMSRQEAREQMEIDREERPCL